MAMTVATPSTPTEDPEAGMTLAPPGRTAARDPGRLEAALQATSQLAVLWAFGLALLLILAHRA